VQWYIGLDTSQKAEQLERSPAPKETVMPNPKIITSNRDYTAADARRMLDNLRSGALGQAVIRYRRSGPAFFVTEERPEPASPPEHDQRAGSAAA
jgi:hypothetical protein